MRSECIWATDRGANWTRVSLCCCINQWKEERSRVLVRFSPSNQTHKDEWRFEWVVGPEVTVGSEPYDHQQTNRPPPTTQLHHGGSTQLIHETWRAPGKGEAEQKLWARPVTADDDRWNLLKCPGSHETATTASQMEIGGNLTNQNELCCYDCGFLFFRYYMQGRWVCIANYTTSTVSC